MSNPADLQYLARRMNRQLSLGRGMLLDADAMALLAMIGVNDLVQQKAAEALKEQARLRHMRGQGAGPVTASPMAPVSLILSPTPPIAPAEVVPIASATTRKRGTVDTDQREPGRLSDDPSTAAYERAREMLLGPTRRAPSAKGKGPSAGRRT